MSSCWRYKEDYVTRHACALKVSELSRNGPQICMMNKKGSGGFTEWASRRCNIRRLSRQPYGLLEIKWNSIFDQRFGKRDYSCLLPQSGTAQVIHRWSLILVFALSDITLELKETEIGVFLWRDCSFKKTKVMWLIFYFSLLIQASAWNCLEPKWLENQRFWRFLPSPEFQQNFTTGLTSSCETRWWIRVWSSWQFGEDKGDIQNQSFGYVSSVELYFTFC